jgi:hypothetical protein
MHPCLLGLWRSSAVSSYAGEEVCECMFYLVLDHLEGCWALHIHGCLGKMQICTMCGHWCPVTLAVSTPTPLVGNTMMFIETLFFTVNFPTSKENDQHKSYARRSLRTRTEGYTEVRRHGHNSHTEPRSRSPQFRTGRTAGGRPQSRTSTSHSKTAAFRRPTSAQLNR